jgi:hypothetical protein
MRRFNCRVINKDFHMMPSNNNKLQSSSSIMVNLSKSIMVRLAAQEVLFTILEGFLARMAHIDHSKVDLYSPRIP